MRVATIALAATCVTAANVSPSSAAADLGAPLNANMPGATLVFQDEFNGSRINNERWSTLRGHTVSYGSPYNPRIEGAAYADRNATASHGAAVLSLRRRSAAGYSQYPYSSGMIQSGRSFSFKYGYVEARVRIPKCAGCWPAFWMLDAPVDRYWPPEIDIFEYFNSARSTRPFFNFHYRSGDGRHHQTGPAPYGEGDSAGEWHTYGLRWTDSSLQVFLDGVAGPNFSEADKLPTRPNYLIFNLGLYKHRHPRSGSKMLIDWVRVWR